MASIQRRPGGKWRARYRDTSGREHARHFDRKVDAQRWLNEVTASVITGSYVDPRAGAITFSTFYADWSGRQVWAPGTRRAMDLAARSVTFGDVPLRALKRSHVELWVKSMTTPNRDRSRPLATGTIHTRVNNVRAVLRGAAADRLIASDPSAGVRLPRRRRADMAMRIPTPQEVGRLLEAADGSFRAFVAVCAFAGLRLGEAAALQVGDVDFLRRQVVVARQVQRSNGGVQEFRPPKYGSERVIPIPDGLVALLAEHVGTYRSREDPDSWVFTGQWPDTPPHQNSVGHRWRTTVRAAGLDGVKLHDLRHFFASGLIAAGCDVVSVQRALGHACATTTLNTYSHLWPSADDRTRAAAASMLAEATLIPADSLRTADGH